jgi:hypothetical protein
MGKCSNEIKACARLSRTTSRRSIALPQGFASTSLLKGLSFFVLFCAAVADCASGKSFKGLAIYMPFI